MRRVSRTDLNLFQRLRNKDNFQRHRKQRRGISRCFHLCKDLGLSENIQITHANLLYINTVFCGRE